VKTIVAGSRTVTDEHIIQVAIEASGFEVTEVVSGAARGVDRLGEAWARLHGIAITRFPADWARHGRAAGPIRNGQMADYAEALVAILDGESRGTKNMIDQARQRGLKVKIHRV
jgi:hypothetical protein